jgi:hypothetical protein
MATPVDTQSFSVRAVDDWVVSQQPSVEAAAAQVAEVRRLAREVRMAEAHLVEYLREELRLDEFAEVPNDLIPDPGADD